MALVPLAFPPGMVRRGTAHRTAGRWFDGNLVRWVDGVLRPWAGWTQIGGCNNSAIGGPVVGLMAWRGNDGAARLLIGTPTKIYRHLNTTLTDITIAGFTGGAADSVFTASTGITVDAATWQFDLFGEDPVLCQTADGRILTYDTSTLPAEVTVVSGAPTGNKSIVVTPEKFLVALAASGDPRLIAWCDQDDITDWTPIASNQAGDFSLPGEGRIMAGRRGRNETLIWTDSDMWAMRYIGGDLVYSFVQLGSACGWLSRHAGVVLDGKAIWMGQNSFFLYDGFVRKLSCEVSDFVFDQLSAEQRAKVHCQLLADFSEVVWYYSNATDNNKYVSYNYVSDHWSMGTLSRSAAIDRGVFDFPISGHPSGGLYLHEHPVVGVHLFIDENTAALVPQIVSGPLQLGQGDNVYTALQYIPDEKTAGEVSLTINTKFYPSALETSHGPYAGANPTSIRLTGREMTVRFTQVTPDWRVGEPSLDVVPGGLR
jgi:hypothetical protein